MPTQVLSRRVAALETCRVLHLAGELDSKLLPIGKESFHLLLSSEELVLDEADELQASKDDEPRPGTNKRRQYYRKRVLRSLAFVAVLFVFLTVGLSVSICR